MNDEQLNGFFKAARSAKPDTAPAEYGFETRLLARLRTERELSVAWPAIAWRLVPAFVAVVAAIGVWIIATSSMNSTDLRSAIAGDEGEPTLVTYFTGD